MDIRAPLYNPAEEHDACGVGFVADIEGRATHRILQMGLTCVKCVTHRGAVSADAKTGDGAGVETQLPKRLFRRELKRLGVAETAVERLAVGMCFLPQDPTQRDQAKAIIEHQLERSGLLRHGWRHVPINPKGLGEHAAATQPNIQQVLIGRPDAVAEEDYERRLYLVRREVERAVAVAGLDCYLPSFSSRTLVYKGLFVAPQLAEFYRDLADPLYETALCVFHQRYSTNTFPNWVLAQPFRLLGHNGEINTLLGNQNWMRAREPELKSPVWGADIQRLVPVIQPGGSDSAKLDNVLELLVMSGFDILHAITLLVPEAWQQMPVMDPDLRAFYEFQACLSEPWDGPAALAFTDGRIVGATLDRNGLRPARYKVTKDGLVVLGSEVGIVELDDAAVIESGRLGPGKMLAVDTANKILLTDEVIKRRLAHQQPYGQWLARQMVRAETLKLNEGKPHLAYSSETWPELTRWQKSFGLNTEDLQLIVKASAATAKEPVGSMGDDAPLAVLSSKPKVLPAYFKQLFAQVTNPPIDPLRERLVMSLNTGLGARGSMLEETETHAKWIKFSSPVLTEPEFQWATTLADPAFETARLSVLFPVADGPTGLRPAVERLCRAAEQAVEEGKTLLVLSDRGVDAQQAAIPMLMAVGAVHHHLIRQGTRMRCSLVCETGATWDIHHYAALLGYGTAAIFPYLAYATVARLVETKELRELDAATALHQYKKSVEDGILKIMSKMGISLLASYRGAQIFEAIGLSREVLDLCFTGTACKLTGIGFAELGAEALALHASAYGVSAAPALDVGGFYRYRRDGELHAFNPDVLDALHTAVHTGRYEDYEQYARCVNEREPIALRDLLEFHSDRGPIPLDQVEPAEVIRKRFCTAGMSYGALSKETHECLAIAMNRIGGKSNSGEGGEDPARFKPYPNGDWANSAIKQVASGRFGVTPEYLASARELEIKMAQGSKPGEGGQLPGHKVSADIARVRHSVPGVTLVSPPPHHDIYSIEDLAQLIYDLKQANPSAKVCVKLVAESGVGTIAAGVAKGYADVVHIAGHDGGTGASPISSIKNAGSPWEIGVAETQQVLVLNNLRDRITVRTDGGLKTGRDIMMAALFGAEEYNFGTAALVAAGCCLVRACHLNTCPVGVATQDPKLRAKFTSPPDLVVNYFNFVAEEVRHWLAQLGYRTLDEVVGRITLVQVAPKAQRHPKWRCLNWEWLLTDPDPARTRPRRHLLERNDRPGDVPLDNTLIKDATPALEGHGRVALRYPIRNSDRTVGAKLCHTIAVRYGDAGLPGGSAIECHFYGSAGQSFGAFLLDGVRFVLTGEANDYVGKGMHGGELVLKFPPRAQLVTHENVILGNTVLYGATGGTLYAAGRGGERFAVRNGGGRAVVEGIGDHGCEYMTGGVVVILGATGRNFGAGMSGGEAYVFDEQETFPQHLNPALVQLERLSAAEDIELVKGMIQRHLELTGSPRAKALLDGWAHTAPRFWKVRPKETVATLEAAVGAPPTPAAR